MLTQGLHVPAMPGGAAGPWSALRGLKPSAQALIRALAKTGAPGRSLLRLAPLSGPPQLQSANEAGGLPAHACAEGTGGRATPRGATIDAQRMAAYAL